MPAVSTFVPFGTSLETGTNPGQISQNSLRRKELLRKRDGLPAEPRSANIGKEGLENPLGSSGALTSFISGESFLHDSRHGELFQFPGYGLKGVQAPGLVEQASETASKESAGANRDGKRPQVRRDNTVLNIPGSANRDRKTPSPHEDLSVDPSWGLVDAARSPFDESSGIPPWENAQKERWKQFEQNREQIRELANASMSRSGPNDWQKGSHAGGHAESKKSASPTSLRSNLRDSTTASPDSRKSISWEDQSTTQWSPTSFRRADSGLEDARRARDAVSFRKEAAMATSSSGGSGASDRSGNASSRGHAQTSFGDDDSRANCLSTQAGVGEHGVQPHLNLKYMDRVAALHQEHHEDAEGPSTPPGFPPVTRSLQEKVCGFSFGGCGVSCSCRIGAGKHYCMLS